MGKSNNRLDTTKEKIRFSRRRERQTLEESDRYLKTRM